MGLAFISHWYVRAELKAEFLDALQELGEAVTPELAATNNYIAMYWNRAGEFVACESWKDADAINAFRASPQFHQAIVRMTACCDRPSVLEVLDALDGDGSVFVQNPAGRADPRYYPDQGPLTATVV